jgi:hypothetical protein
MMLLPTFTPLSSHNLHPNGNAGIEGWIALVLNSTDMVLTTDIWVKYENISAVNDGTNTFAFVHLMLPSVKESRSVT